MASEVEIAGVREGDVLDGKYRIDRVLGAGGMGVVVAAHHLHLDERVALKFLLPQALSNVETVARFAREARAAVKIKSEHVARVIDVGTLSTGAPYMVMEYLEGGDLDAWIKQRGALPVDQAVEFVLQACEAIADAHALGIVHRDLKPANLFCVRRSDGLLSVKVLDFGISKVTSGSATGPSMQMTKTTAVMGSPYYMSPEQMTASRDVDGRTDIWSLGVIMHELLTGVVPFNGETLPEVCVKIATQPLAPPRALRPDLPEGLAAVIAKCLQKRREDRYQNVAELAVALAPFAPKRARNSIERIARVIETSGIGPASAIEMAPLSEPAPPANSAGTLAGARGTQASWGQTASSPRNRSREIALIAGGIGVFICIGIVALAVLRKPHDESAAAASASVATPAAQPASAAAIAPEVAPAATPSSEAKPQESSTPVASAAPAVSATSSVHPVAATTAARPKKPKAPPTAAAPAPAEKWGGRQ